MAGFKTHITVSTLAGVAGGAAAYSMYGFPPEACILAGGLCSVSGMLPDIDSDSGTPVRESLSFAAAVVSTMLVDRFRQFGLSTQSIVLAAAAAYIVVRFGLGWLLKRYTVHRGMFHSIPAAIVAGELAFLLAAGPLKLRLLQAGAVTTGYLVHLILDEFYSVQMKRGRVSAKKSLGTALKLWGGSGWANLSTYAKLALISAVVWFDIQQPNRFTQITEAWEDDFWVWAEESFLADAGEDTPSDPRDRAPTATHSNSDRFSSTRNSARPANTRYAPATDDDVPPTFQTSSPDRVSPARSNTPQAGAARTPAAPPRVRRIEDLPEAPAAASRSDPAWRQ